MIPRCLKAFKKFSLTLIISDHDNYGGMGLNFGHLDNLDLQNETIRSAFVEFGDYCGRLCSKPNCETDVTLTNMYAQHPTNQGLSFRVYVPRSANVNLVYKPDMILLDYLTFILSCIGAWLGLSVLKLNPVNIWRYVTADDHKRPQQGWISSPFQVRNLGTIKRIC